MSIAEDFLTPRTLIIDNSFCCRTDKFQKLKISYKNVKDLPSNQEYFMMTSGLTSLGWSAIIKYVHPIMEEFSKVKSLAFSFEEEFSAIGQVCDGILGACSTAKADYDELFDGLAKLYEDPSNDSLRVKVTATIADRLNNVSNLSDLATITKEDMNDSTINATVSQATLDQLSDNLQNPEVEKLLREYVSDPEDLQGNLDAAIWTRNTISGIDVNDSCGPPLDDLGKAVGAVAAIAVDLQDVKKSLEDDTDPALSPILDLNEANILELWDHLAEQVREFKANYTNT